MHWFQQLVSQSFNSGKISRKGWATRNCPCCIFRGETPDKRYRLGLRIDGHSVGMNCFNCGFKALWKPGERLSANFRMYFTAIGYSTESINEINFNLFKEADSNSEVIADEMRKFSITSWEEIQFPECTLSISEWITLGYSEEKFISVVEYATARKLDGFFNRLYYSIDKDYENRIIIPYYYEGKLVGYTGREATHKNSPRKYINNNPLEFIYNLDHQKDYKRKFVILTEGIIDALLVDGITTFGNKISSAQINLINQLNKDIIVLPDYDEAGEALVKIAIENNWKVSLPNWKYKDVAESVKHHGRIYTLRQILDSIEYKEFNISVKWKMKLKELK